MNSQIVCERGLRDDFANVAAVLAKRVVDPHADASALCALRGIALRQFEQGGTGCDQRCIEVLIRTELHIGDGPATRILTTGSSTNRVPS
jgi:hypothetical protein